MKRAIITVGLGFGDEGKGATVDHLVRHFGADLVVRYCGGSQAGHNVELPDGHRHTFSQFGAGTLAHRTRTYLGPNVVIDPPAIVREAAHLSELGVENPTGMLTIHPRCLVTTMWHKMLNRLRELSRGVDRHGSCGQGIGEARRYWLDHGRDAVFAADLRDVHMLRAKLELQRQRALIELQSFIHQIDDDARQELRDWDVDTESVAAELTEAGSSGFSISPEVPACGTAIFEGAQGVLLDEYHGFHPHTTWSTVTAHHAWELLQQAGAKEVAVLGVTRAYVTRHGAGPLPSYCPDLTARLRDVGNPANPWQGQMRCGWLDLPLLRYAAAAAGPLDGIVVNHLDQVAGTGWQVCEAYAGLTLGPSDAPNLSRQERLGRELEQVKPVLAAATAERIVRRLGEIAPVVLTGHGPSWRQRRPYEITFHRRRAAPGGTDPAPIMAGPVRITGRA
jgi:adenylosuccinate synthase